MSDKKVVLITDATSTTGREIARQIFYMGARVVLGCRNDGEATYLEQYIRTHKITRLLSMNGELTHIVLDFANLTALRRNITTFISQEQRLDILINNHLDITANDITVDEHDLQIQTNYWSTFLITTLLLPVMKRTLNFNKKIINFINGNQACGRLNFKDLNLTEFKDTCLHFSLSNVMLIYFSKKLGRVLISKGLYSIKVIMCHNEIMETKISTNNIFYKGLKILQYINHGLNYLLDEIDQSTATVLHCVTTNIGMSGYYYKNSVAVQPPDTFSPLLYQQALWNKTIRLLNIIEENYLILNERDPHYEYILGLQTDLLALLAI